MKLGYLEQFVVLAETLNYRAAADRLHVSVSTLSGHIAHLEADIGGPLLVRDRHGCELTAAGRVLVDAAGPALDQVDRAVDLARRVAEGSTRPFTIGHNGGLGAVLVRHALAALRTIHPRTRFEITEDPTSGLRSQILDGVVDVALVHPPLHEAAIAEQHLCDEPLVLAVPDTSPHTRRADLNLSQLAGEPLVVPSPRHAPGAYQTTVDLWRRAGHTVAVTLDATSPLSMLVLVGSGAGVALVPRHAVGLHPIAGVVTVPLPDPAPTLPVHAAWLAADNSPLLHTAREALQTAALHLEHQEAGRLD